MAERRPGRSSPGRLALVPGGTIAAGVGAPGSQIQFADLTGDGRADYLVGSTRRLGAGVGERRPGRSSPGRLALVPGGYDRRRRRRPRQPDPVRRPHRRRPGRLPRRQPRQLGAGVGERRPGPAAPDGWLWSQVGTIAPASAPPAARSSSPTSPATAGPTTSTSTPTAPYKRGSTARSRPGRGGRHPRTSCTAVNSPISLSVTIEVSQDMVRQSSAPPPGSGSAPLDGFGFQLNAYSPTGGLCAYQQYAIALIGTELTGAVDNWRVERSKIINDFFGLASLPSVAIPAGYVLQISLGNDNSGNVVVRLMSSPIIRETRWRTRQWTCYL